MPKPEQPSEAAGSIEMQLEGGDYTIRASSDDRIHVSFAGDAGDSTATVTASGAHANLAIKDRPHKSFRATVEVLAPADLTVRISAGNVSIALPNSCDYAGVETAVTVGNLDAGPFGESGSGLAPHLKWSGTGKYRLRAVLGGRATWN